MTLGTPASQNLYLSLSLKIPCNEIQTPGYTSSTTWQSLVNADHIVSGENFSLTMKNWNKNFLKLIENFSILFYEAAIFCFEILSLNKNAATGFAQALDLLFGSLLCKSNICWFSWKNLSKMSWKTKQPTGKVFAQILHINTNTKKPFQNKLNHTQPVITWSHRVSGNTYILIF